MKRTLSLRSEALAPLTADELGGLAGAAGQLSGASCPVVLCKASIHPHCPSGFTCPTE